MIDTITLANKAQELLSNDAFIEAVRRVETHIIDTWRNTNPLDADERECLYHQQQALASMIGNLTDMKDEPGLYEDETLDETETEDQ
jgi:hypothetical protein